MAALRALRSPCFTAPPALSSSALRSSVGRFSPSSRRPRPALRRARAQPAVVAVAAPPADGLPPDLVLRAGMFAAGPVLNVFTLIMVIRIVLTWYPRTDLKKKPWIFLAVPTEPLLAATRNVIKPVGGVDISPIVWVAISTFVHEILMGPQGLLVLMANK